MDKFDLIYGLILSGTGMVSIVQILSKTPKSILGLMACMVYIILGAYFLFRYLKEWKRLKNIRRIEAGREMNIPRVYGIAGINEFLANRERDQQYSQPIENTEPEPEPESLTSRGNLEAYPSTALEREVARQLTNDTHRIAQNSLSSFSVRSQYDHNQESTTTELVNGTHGMLESLSMKQKNKSLSDVDDIIDDLKKIVGE